MDLEEWCGVAVMVLMDGTVDYLKKMGMCERRRRERNLMGMNLLVGVGLGKTKTAVGLQDRQQQGLQRGCQQQIRTSSKLGWYS